MMSWKERGIEIQSSIESISDGILYVPVRFPALLFFREKPLLFERVSAYSTV